MLARDEGSSGPQAAEATSWAPHTVRSFVAGLAKKGIVIKTIKRACLAGPNKAGAKGRCSVHRLVAEAEG